MADRLPAIDTSMPVGQRYPVVVREEIIAVAAGSIVVTKESIGLGNVDNTSDLNKPISTATQAALDAKLDKTSGASKLYGTDGSGASTTYSVSSATSAAGTVPQRGSGGVVVVGTPTADAHAATKAYVDAAAGGGIADGAVTTAKLATDAVTQAKIADNAVGSAEIIDGSVGTAELSDSSVTSAKIVDGTIVNADIAAAAAIAGSKIATGGISATQLATNAVTTVKITDLNVTTAKLADGAVTAAKITDATITKAKLETAVQNSLTRADSALTGTGVTSVWMGTLGSLPASGTAGVLYVVTG
ncbi:hypothetical protein SEA_LIGMA_36 [Gordonia phage Ligma]|nr:hypothetical protein SEA_LIGMA_36 [Gordonia phage Ligma]UQT02137.1 minor tail protein [Gordonia phage Axumite]